MANYQDYRAWKHWDQRAFGSRTQMDDKYYMGELRRAGYTTVAGMKVVELGFGNGPFAGFAREHGMDYLGVEVDPILVERANAAGFTATSNNISCLGHSQGGVDLLVAFDVFEHLRLEDLQKTLSEVRKLLRDGGRLLARMPSGDSPFGRAIAHGDITHQTTLGSSAIVQLAVANGFHLCYVSSPVMPLTGGGVRRFLRRILLSIAQICVAKLINVLFHDNQSKVITANLVFVLEKPIVK